MTIFYIIRHGNTELNNEDVLQGQIDSPLTEEGYNDAKFRAKRLKNIKFDAIFSSDLGRTFITAHIIADSLGLTNKLIRAKELREINYGDLTGKQKNQVMPEYLKLKKDSKVRAPNGESHLDVKRRVVKKLYEISKINYKNVLIVTHNNCIRSIISETQKKDLDLFLTKKISHRFIARLEIKNNKILNFGVINK